MSNYSYIQIVVYHVNVLLGTSNCWKREEADTDNVLSILLVWEIPTFDICSGQFEKHWEKKRTKKEGTIFNK